VRSTDTATFASFLESQRIGSMSPRHTILSLLATLFLFTGLHAQEKKKPIKLPDGVPEKVGKVLAYIDENNKAMEGYEGGRNFGNFERLLPQKDDKGRQIRYREWDVNPLRRGVNRGAQRLITGANGTAYYTDDHYKSFKKIR
jgi:guanyl-specific ribonuclease Sa